jgi:hypothetical protein
MIRFYETLSDVMKAMNCGKMPDLDTAMAMREDTVRMVEAEEVHAGENVSTPGVHPRPSNASVLVIAPCYLFFSRAGRWLRRFADVGVESPL